MGRYHAEHKVVRILPFLTHLIPNQLGCGVGFSLEVFKGDRDVQRERVLFVGWFVCLFFKCLEDESSQAKDLLSGDLCKLRRMRTYSS